MEGAVYGIVAAIGLGVNNVLVAIASRRWGVMWTTAVALVIAFVILIGYAVVGRLSFHPGLDMILFLSFLGAAAASAYLTSFQALKLGPVSVVSPITAGSGPMTVLFAFAFIGERPHVVQWAGIPIAAMGAVMASLVVERRTAVRLIGRGPVFAFLSVVTGAVSNAGLRIPIRSFGSVQAILIQRTFTVAYVWLILLIGHAWRRNGETGNPGFPRLARKEVNSPPVPRQDRRTGTGLLLVIGFLDAISFISFARGLAVAPAWLIGLLSQSGRAIAVIGGILVFKERLSGSQWTGIALMVAGLALSLLG